MIPWDKVLPYINPTNLVLLIVIFWLMRQNALLVAETFKSHSSLNRLTSLLERLVLEKKE